MTYVRFVSARLIQAIPVLFGVTIVLFLLIHLVPGDPARTALGQAATPAAVNHLDHLWGLDRPLPEQYWLFLKRLLAGNLGTSLLLGEPAVHLVIHRLPVTLWLLAYATVLTCVSAVPAALVAAARPGAFPDRVVRTLSVTLLGIPGFWLGLMLIEFVAVRTGWFPSAGFGSGFSGHLRALFLPALTISAGIIPLVIRSLRVEMLQVTQADFVTTARAKGVSERRIRVRHILRNALGPAVTVLAVSISFLVGGTLVIEQVFSLGGVGSLMLQAIDGRDFPVVQAVSLVLAVVVVTVNIVGDVLQAMLDPRVAR